LQILATLCPQKNSLRTTAASSGNGRYLRLTGERHAEDGDAAKNALPTSVTNALQPLPAEEPVLEGRQHNLQRGERKRVKIQPKATQWKQQCRCWDKRQRAAALRGTAYAAYHSPISISQIPQLPTPPTRFIKAPSNLAGPLATEDPGVCFKRSTTFPPCSMPSDIIARTRRNNFH